MLAFIPPPHLLCGRQLTDISGSRANADEGELRDKCKEKRADILQMRVSVTEDYSCYNGRGSVGKGKQPEGQRFLWSRNREMM